MISFELKDLAWIVGLVGVIGGFLLMLLRSRLSDTFVTKADLSAAMDGSDKRLVAIEQRLSTIPTHMEVADLNRRLGEVERGVAVVGQQVEGTRQLLTRVEHQLGLLVAQRIQESRE